MASTFSGRCLLQIMNPIWSRQETSGGESGQAVVETLIILPLLIALIAGVSWVGLMGRTKIILTIATREGARIAAQGEKAAAVSLVRKLCVENLPFPAGEVRVRVIPSLTAVTVRGEVEVKGLFQSDDRQYLVTASTSMPRTIFSF